MSLKKHKTALAFYLILLIESFVSGYYCEITAFFIVSRLGVLSVAVVAKHFEQDNILKWLSLIIAIFSLTGIREKYSLIEAEKLASEKNKLVVEMLAPIPPIMPAVSDCSILPRFARPDCDAGNKSLQAEYARDFKKYKNELSAHNAKIVNRKKTENELKPDLTFYDLLPLAFYCLLIGALSVLSVIAIQQPKKPKSEKQTPAPTNSPALSSIDKVKLIETRNRNEKISQELLCKEYKISLSEFKRVRAKLKLKGEPKSGPSENFKNLGLEGMEENYA